MSTVSVPPEFQSLTPGRLRELALECKFEVGSQEHLLLSEAAAEIEGGEEAYAVLIGQVHELREKLARTEKNLQATIALVPSRSG
jgi:hypothetical protein